MPAVEYTFGSTAASSAPRREAPTSGPLAPAAPPRAPARPPIAPPPSVPRSTPAPPPASAASLIASSGGTSSRSRCVCESTNMAPVPSPLRDVSGAHYTKGRGLAVLGPLGPARRDALVDVPLREPRLPGRPRRRPRRPLPRLDVPPGPHHGVFEAGRGDIRPAPHPPPPPPPRRCPRAAAPHPGVPPPQARPGSAGGGPGAGGGGGGGGRRRWGFGVW